MERKVQLHEIQSLFFAFIDKFQHWDMTRFQNDQFNLMVAFLKFLISEKWVTFRELFNYQMKKQRLNITILNRNYNLQLITVKNITIEIVLNLLVFLLLEFLPQFKTSFLEKLFVNCFSKYYVWVFISTTMFINFNFSWKTEQNKLRKFSR